MLIYHETCPSIDPNVVIGIVTGISEDHLMYDIGTRVGHLTSVWQGIT